jgi:CRP-like cAMP-binding protein
MLMVPSSLYRNSLLRKMDPLDLSLLEPHLALCELPHRMAIESAGVPVAAIYFVETGVISVVAKHSRRDAEIGLIGREGMTGSSVVMGGGQTPHESYVQLAGEAMRIDLGPLAEALASSPTMRTFLLRFAQSLHVQTGYTALVNARSNLRERLARWLLMCDDRMAPAEIPIIHEFLATMLGIRRPSVTVALQVLEGLSLIRSTRGNVEIRNRAGLAKIACQSSYGEPEAEYDRLLGPPGEPVNTNSPRLRLAG